MDLLIFIINSDYFCGNYKQITDDTVCCIIINPMQHTYTIIDNKNNIIEHGNINSISTSLEAFSKSLTSSKHLVYHATCNTSCTAQLTTVPEATSIILNTLLRDNQCITFALIQNQLQTSRQEVRAIINMLIKENKLVKYYSYWKSLMYTNDKQKRE